MLVDVLEKPTVSPRGKNAALLLCSVGETFNQQGTQSCTAYFSLLRCEQTTVIKNISVRPAYVCSCCYL